jgi:hypothetical protein
VKELTQSQEAVFEAFVHVGPMHDQRLLQEYNLRRKTCQWPPLSESGLRTRRSELVALDYLEASGETVTLPSGRQSIIWQIT